MTGTPHRVAVASQKVAELVFEKIFPAMQGEPTDAMVLSLLCAAVLAMKPSIDQEELQRIIIATSGYIITELQEAVPSAHVN